MVFAGERLVGDIKNLLVLAGTGEARQLIASLLADNRFKMTASLSGLTSKPFSLDVRTRSGGFGGVDGLINYVQKHNIKLIADMTHPYAVKISNHVALVAEKLSLPTVAFYRPPWRAKETDQWVEFDSWEAMARNLPTGANLFLARGSRNLDVFCERRDITLLIRGLNLKKYKEKYCDINIVESLPYKSIEREVQLLREYAITHICCKNSGGTFSEAKLRAANQLGLPVWMLKRPLHPINSRYYRIFYDIDSVIDTFAI